MIGEATYIACRHKQQLLPSTKQELPAWIYVRGKVQFESMCCLQGIECTANEGPVRIQYKCLVSIYVFPEMKLCSLVISKT